MFQKKVEAVTMVMMPQMTEFMQKHIVLKNGRQAHDAQVKIDISL